MKLLQELRIPYQKNPDLLSLVAERMQVAPEGIAAIRVLKRSLDARQPRRPMWSYRLEIHVGSVEPEAEVGASWPKLSWSGPPPLIIGAGPAGLFAAWTFLRHGIRPVLLERGDRTHERMLRISRYWRKNELDADSNVCYGEGGAGTFSDGKLMTRIKSPWIQAVMREFVDCGAPPEIVYAYNPHVGSNLIREVIRAMCDRLAAQGATLRFRQRVDRLALSSGRLSGVVLESGEELRGTGLILACGHSARPFLQRLSEQGVAFEAKSFALGLRIEHAQSAINRWQYGDFSSAEELEPAQYKLSAYWSEEAMGIYSFCMCPGGYVIASSTDDDAMVVNGMSNFHRNSRWANAAIVGSVAADRVSGEDPFRLLEWQRNLERGAYELGGASGKVPAQRLEDFLQKRLGKLGARSSCPSGVVPADLSSLLPDWLYRRLVEGFRDFEKKRPGFYDAEALLHGIESRTSSPVRIPRDPETLESVSTEGLFPCGEGPGYAGGITSAAVDGIRAALAWIKKYATTS